MSEQSATSLFLARVVFLLGFLAAISDALAINRSKFHHNRTDRRQRTRNNIQTLYHQMCPVVACPEDTSECIMVEHIVREFSDPRSGQVIRCHGCPYCLDYPPRQSSSSRQRRGLLDVIFPNAIKPDSGAVVSCPNLPDSCSEVRMTRTWVGGRSTAPWSVTRCPVCFDQKPSIRHHRPASSTAVRRPLSL